MLFYSACMCTAPADTIEIRDLFFNNPIETHHLSQSVFYSLNIKSAQVYNESKKGFCLTYNKVMAADVILNPIVSKSIRLTCNRTIDTTQSGHQLLKIMEKSSESLIDSYWSVDNKKLTLDSTYIFYLEAFSSKGEKFTDTLSVKIVK